MAFAIAVIVFMVGPSSSHIVLLYTIAFGAIGAIGAIWYLVAVRGRLRRGQAGPSLALQAEAEEEAVTGA